MARRGVWQLKKLVINYCDHSGSSIGTRYVLVVDIPMIIAHKHACQSECREFLKSWLPRFREENPHLEIAEVLRRGGHPFLEASYGKLLATQTNVRR